MELFRIVCCINCEHLQLVVTRLDKCSKCGQRMFEHNELDDIIKDNSESKEQEINDLMSLRLLDEMRKPKKQ